MTKKLNVFFINHINDFDFIVPVIYFSKKSVIIFLNISDQLKNHPMYNYVNKTHICYELSLPKFSKIQRMFPEFIKQTYKEFNNNKKVKSILSIFEDFNVNELAIYFEHGTNPFYRRLQDNILNLKKINSVFYSLPHGCAIIDNTMQTFEDISLLKIEKKNSFKNAYDNYTKIIVDDETQRKLMLLMGIKKQKLLLIENIRFTKKWSDILLRHYKTNFKFNYLNDKKKINIIFMLTKLNANVFTRELYRCMRIISSFKNLNIILRSHPRGLKEAEKINKHFANKFLIDNRHLTPCIYDRISYVVALPSSAIYEAIIRNIPVIFPRYMSSSNLSEKLTRLVNIPNTPDEFYDCIQKISKGEHKHFVKTKYKNYIEKKNWNFIND